MTVPDTKHRTIIDTALEDIAGIVGELREDVNRSREVSLAITNLQQAAMWLREDLRIMQEKPNGVHKT